MFRVLMVFFNIFEQKFFKEVGRMSPSGREQFSILPKSMNQSKASWHVIEVYQKG
jgi:hypothetical protein